MEQNMNILIVEPGKPPRPAAIPNTLEAVEKTLGGAGRWGNHGADQMGRQETGGSPVNSMGSRGNGKRRRDQLKPACCLLRKEAQHYAGRNKG